MPYQTKQAAQRDLKRSWYGYGKGHEVRKGRVWCNETWKWKPCWTIVYTGKHYVYP